MNKKDREIVFNKFGGRCAYCGCELKKGWHVDEILPVRRKTKKVKGYWHLPNGEVVPNNSFTEDEMVSKGIRWKEERWVADGYENPENMHIDNQYPACAKCNINKHSMSVDGFRESIVGYLNSLNLRMVQYQMVKKYGLIQETGIEVKFYFETVTV